MTKAIRFSKLSAAEQEEILSSTAYRQYADQIKQEDWLFIKIAGRWATY